MHDSDVMHDPEAPQVEVAHEHHEHHEHGAHDRHLVRSHAHEEDIPGTVNLQAAG